MKHKERAECIGKVAGSFKNAECHGVVSRGSGVGCVGILTKGKRLLENYL